MSVLRRPAHSIDRTPHLRAARRKPGRWPWPLAVALVACMACSDHATSGPRPAPTPGDAAGSIDDASHSDDSDGAASSDASDTRDVSDTRGSVRPADASPWDALTGGGGEPAVVYFTEYQGFADVSVYITEYEGFADCVIHRTPYQGFATVTDTWYETEYEGFASVVVYLTEYEGFADYTVAFTEYSGFASCDVDWSALDD